MSVNLSEDDMPIFEFRCSSCGHLEEVLQKATAPAPDPCPRCNKANTMAKELSVSAFHLKGGGWYKDLYSSGGAAAETAAPSSAPAEASPTTTAAATPAAAAAAPATTATAPATSTSTTTPSSGST
jgi:putative FmdB family regulatory protein